MALQVNNFTGFETGDTLEALSIAGSPTFPITDVRSGGRKLFLDVGSEKYTLPWVDNVTDAGGDYIIGFAVKFASTSSDPTAFATVSDTNGSIIEINVDNNNSIVVESQGVDQITSSEEVIGTSSYHYIEVYFQHSDSGNAELFIDGVSQGTATAQDFSRGGSLDSTVGLLFNHDGSNDISIDDVYILSGASSASDAFGDAEVFPYQNTAEDATDQGDTLADGTWALVSETPLNEGTSNDAQYVDTGNLTGSTICDEGTRAGPSGDANVDGDSNIKAAKWIGRFKRGAGGGRTHNFYGGNDGAGANHATWIASNDAKTLAMSLDTVYATFTMLSESTEVPSSTEDFQYGFSKSATGGQDIFCGDIWAMLLHVPSTGPAPTINLVMAPYIPI